MNPVRSLKKYFLQKEPKTKVGFAFKIFNKDNQVWTSNGVNSLIYQKKQKGQAMLLAVLLIGTSVLVITSLSGYMMLQRIRMGFNFVDSTRAIFAADAGVECEFYNSFKGASVDCDGLDFSDPLTKVQTIIVADDNGVPQYIKSIGTSNKSNRAFVAEFK